MRWTLRRRSAMTAPALALWCAACGPGDLLSPEDVPNLGRVSAGNGFSCAVGGDRRVRCWGDNSTGQLGNGTLRNRPLPALVTGDVDFVEVSTRPLGRHACGLGSGGRAYCWGANDFGQVGDGTFDVRTTPVEVSFDEHFVTVSAGWRFSCAIATTGAAYCWGRGEWGQLGNGDTANHPRPVPVAGGHLFRAISVGSNNIVCGLSVEGRPYCWGLAWQGEIGAPTAEQCTLRDLTLPCATTPVAVAVEGTFAAVAAGHSYACAIDDGGRAWCWGNNGDGRLGVATTESCFDAPCTPVPTLVPDLPPLASLSAGVTHTCAVSRTGAAYCWGDNGFGQLGDGLVAPTGTPPVPVSGEIVFRAVSAGGQHTCGEAMSGALYCWGINDIGQLGNGTTQIGLFPTPVGGGA